ncbi:sigma-70 family RNA polymerase sigma factor [Microbispora hainanensis]|uniref:Sigma-70 family RNA polymerase sigma factor n=1 Tax=Microbispora hainanensis TaxID=568844 RepID=A0A544YRG9_9ACTN|nr:sigma-70 family RNA polymerase sigma factor [Microbispora hainanensis]TQS19384.1 sigma-70 family RNA polymerase sigma factor [Microbispora hainanensis]
MDENGLAARFEEQRPRLRAVAYRMLGSHAEADDAVQNAWLRLSGADTAEVANLAGWLTTVVARECLNMLRARRNRREEPLPEGPAEVTAELSAEGHDAGDPEAEALLADSIGPALMVVLDGLAPAERLAFVLHDVFAVPFGEIANILGRSPAATRQLASRARRRVVGAIPPRQVDIARQRRVVDAFLAALRHGDFDGLLAVLDPDVLLSEGDAEPVRGARAVGAHALTFSRAARFVRPALVDGAVGLAIVPRGRLIGALAFTFDHDKIAGIEAIDDPGRLRHVDLAALRS